MVFIKTYAQQLPQFSQFLNNYTILNPANALNDENQINLGARSQMIGFGLEPTTIYCIGNFTLKPKNLNQFNPSIKISKEIPKDTTQYNRFRQGLGGGIISDRYGALNSFYIQSFYALGYQFTKEWLFSFALKGTYSNISINPDRISVLNINDPYATYSGGDMLFDQVVSSGAKNAMQFGVFGTLKSKELLLGIGIDNISIVQFSDNNLSHVFTLKPQLTLLASHSFEIEEYFTIKTGVLLKKMNPTPSSIEASILVIGEKGFYGGLNYRHQSSVGAIAGIRISNKFKLGYSYDFLTTRLHSFSNGGHEITLGYVL